MKNNNAVLTSSRSDFSILFVNIALILYPATVLLVPKMNGLIFGLLLLVSLVFAIRSMQVFSNLSSTEKIFFMSICLFFLSALLSTLYAGVVYKTLGKYLYLLSAIPIYVYLKHVGIRLSYLWYGLIVGAIITAFIASYEVLIVGLGRARSITHPIIFGDIALVMGCMSMAGLGWFKNKSSWQIALPVVALLCGVFASILSQSRGGWLAVPFLIVLLFWYLQSSFSFKFKITLAVFIIVFMGATYTIPQTKVSYQIHRTIASLEAYNGSEIRSDKRTTSVGTRLEMWQASWKIFIENPVLGVGWGHYQKQAIMQVEQGLRNQKIARHSHPHNQFISALASGGIIGFVAILLLFLIPASLFIKTIKHDGNKEVQRLALAGLVLIVSYIIFGMSESILERSRPVNFFAFYLAVFMAAIYGQKEVISRKS